MKLLYHFLLFGLSVGLALGLDKAHASPVISYPIAGLAATLGLSFVVRLFLETDI